MSSKGALERALDGDDGYLDGLKEKKGQVDQRRGLGGSYKIFSLAQGEVSSKIAQYLAGRLLPVEREPRRAVCTYC
eukprot:8229670-Ditylum_brightwellii.AAC.1